jgi:hypothetical protein
VNGENRIRFFINSSYATSGDCPTKAPPISRTSCAEPFHAAGIASAFLLSRTSQQMVMAGENDHAGL